MEPQLKKFVTYRRFYLDLFLGEQRFTGRVLDVGGERATGRGSFSPPLSGVAEWVYVNIDPATKPDILAGAGDIPVESGSFDYVLLTEVLEHLEKPDSALAEAHRVLKAGGRIVASMPFIFAQHGDPHDFQRWTKQKFGAALAEHGFVVREIRPMGGILCSMADLAELYWNYGFEKGGGLGLPSRILRFLLRRVFLKLLFRMDARTDFTDRFTTGYFVVAEKRAS